MREREIAVAPDKERIMTETRLKEGRWLQLKKKKKKTYMSPVRGKTRKLGALSRNSPEKDPENYVYGKERHKLGMRGWHAITLPMHS